jgi:methyltransferase (TIGR00027 family)
MTVLDGDPGEAHAGPARRALRAAMARAWETFSERPLFTDPYARLFVDATGPHEVPATPDHQRSLVDYAAARTKWFDDYFLASSSSGLSQVVILAAGYDARAWRLPWLADTVIYEIDQPQVLELKQRILSESGISATAEYVPVPVDDGEDWLKALRAKGFDHTEPTSWAAEGLFSVLDSDARNRLLEQIELYSARGSHIAVETAAGTDDGISCWLCARHWEVNSIDAEELLTRYHRAPTPGIDDPGAHSVFLDGRKL